MNHSFHQYYIFYTVAQTNNFSAAANRLFISQPAVSKAISHIEKDLGTLLFYRTTKGVKLTEAGELLYRQLEIAFQAIESGEEQIKKNEASGAGKLTIGVSTTLCKYVLLPYLRQFIHENPHVKVSISCQSSYETIEALKKGTLDIGLIGEPESNTDLHFLKLRTITDDFVCTGQYLNMLRSENSNKNIDTASLLSKATLLLLDGNNLTRQYIDKYMLQNQLVSDQIIEVTTMDLLIEFAKTGLGIACVIRDFVERDLKEGSLVIFPTNDPIPARQIGFAYNRSSPMSKAMTKFLNGITYK